ncbi:MAG: hypothetical protein J7K68_02870 [Candidatus Diapherotrites archaeon]|nr:hypothetical protein [Candidatus Diapherotrites archaeon]
MDFILKFLFVIYFFGPAVAIPYALPHMDLFQIFLWTLMTHSVLIVLLFSILDLLEYELLHRQYIIERFCEFTNKRIREVESNTERIFEKFSNRFGHLGYYFSVAFVSFSVGFMWAALISYALRLNRIRAFFSILWGSTISFGFWYLILHSSLTFISPDMFALFGVVMGILFLFYGRIREQKIFSEIKNELKNFVRRRKH